MVAQLLQITFLLVLAYLILAHADAFGTATNAASASYNSAVQTLQGR